MAEPVTTLMDTLRADLGGAVLSLALAHGEVTLEVAPERFAQIALHLRDRLGFEQLMDLCGVDYLSYGDVEWDTRDVSSEGFSRAVEGKGAGRFVWGEQPGGVDGIKPGIPGRRYAVVVHLLSIRDNRRLRVRCYCADDALPVVPSLIDVWPGVNWFEREAFDLFGIIFDGHPDLRRLLTDYGFVGHPFRKDFPLIGNVEVRYDADKQRVIYEPVSIEPRVLVPRVIRDDSRWEQAANELPDHAKPRPPMPAPGSAQTRTEN